VAVDLLKWDTLSRYSKVGLINSRDFFLCSINVVVAFDNWWFKELYLIFWKLSILDFTDHISVVSTCALIWHMYLLLFTCKWGLGSKTSFYNSGVWRDEWVLTFRKVSQAQIMILSKLQNSRSHCTKIQCIGPLWRMRYPLISGGGCSRSWWHGKIAFCV